MVQGCDAKLQAYANIGENRSFQFEQPVGPSKSKEDNKGARRTHEASKPNPQPSNTKSCILSNEPNTVKPKP